MNVGRESKQCFSNKEFKLDPQGDEKPLWGTEVWVGILIISSQQTTLQQSEGVETSSTLQFNKMMIIAQITKDEICKTL